jgi:hypothetical protein
MTSMQPKNAQVLADVCFKADGEDEEAQDRRRRANLGWRANESADSEGLRRQTADR